MTRPVEFRRQIFRTADQWKHGEANTLRRVENGGFALFSRPAFAEWVTRDQAATEVRSLAVDDCGRAFWIREDRDLYGYDPANGLIEPLVTIGESRRDVRQDFGRAIAVCGRLWIVDRTGSRLLALRTDTWQIVADLSIQGIRDAAFAAGRLYALAADGIHVFDVEGTAVGGPFTDQLSEPVALGADPNGSWIYAVDRRRSGFLRYAAPSGTFDSELGRFDDAKPGFAPYLIVVDREGSLLVSDGSAEAHEFSTDGGYVGSTGDIGPVTAIRSLATDPEGQFYVGASEGIARFTRDSGIAGNKGQFYSRTLDSGADDEEWHRLDLAAELDAAGALDVFYASTGDPAVAAAVNGIFDRPGTGTARVKALEGLIGDRWKGPQPLRALPTAAAAGDFARGMTHSVLFRTGTKRYLWLKLEMSGLAPRAGVSVRELRVYYPRLSYLRYLPAVYRQDPVSSEFLERFLAMFETVLGGLEETIDRIPEVFDPALTPAPFLDWLALWLDLSVEEDWPERVKRALIANASDLYQRKGTPGGLSDFIEIVTGTRPVIREAFDAEQPLVLGDRAYLGIGSRIFHQPMADVPAYRRTVLGSGAVLGGTELGAVTRVPANPFRAAAHRFTILLRMPPARFRRLERGLRRIVRETVPAHVSYDIRLTLGADLGADAILGINTGIANPPPLRVGYATLGRTICAGDGGFGPELEVDAILDGPDSDAAHDCADGER